MYCGASKSARWGDELLDWPAFLSAVDGDCKMCASTHCLHPLTEEGQTEVVQLLVDAGADVNQEDDEAGEHTALMLAAIHGRIEIVMILVAAGGDVNKKS